MYRKIIREGIDETGSPDMKYYAFDWDDNIMIMPTKIILKDDEGNEVGMSTEDFAEHRIDIGKIPFEYKGSIIVDYADEPFRYFRPKGNKQFIIDSLTAKPGPAWPDFIEAINNGSIFAIVTARGHNPEVIKESIYNLIVTNHNGIDSNELIKNLEKYRDIVGDDNTNKKDIIREYLDLCKYYPVTFGEGSASNPEEGKINALREFVSYVKAVSKFINKKAYLKNKITNKFLPTIGFSDDDIRNVDKVKSYFEKEPDNIIKTYSTSGGVKKAY